MNFFVVVVLALVVQGQSKVLNKRDVDSLPVFTDLRPDQDTNIVDTPDIPLFTDLRPDQNVNIVDTPDIPIFTDLRPDQNVNIVETPDLPIFTDLRPDQEVDIVDNPNYIEISHLPAIDVGAHRPSEDIELPGEIGLPNLIPDLQEEIEESSTPGVEEDSEVEVVTEPAPEVESKPEGENKPEEIPASPIEEAQSACDLCFEQLVVLISALENSF